MEPPSRLTKLSIENANELGERIVRDLSSPQLLHRLDVQVLDAYIGVLLGNGPCELEEPVDTAVLHIPMPSGHVHLRTLTISAPNLLAAQFPLRNTQSRSIRLKEARRLDAATVAAGEEVLESKVIPDGITLSGYDVGRGLYTHDAEPIVTAVVSLDGHGLDDAFIRTVCYILVVPAEDGDVIAVMELIPSLLQRERGVLLPLAEVRDAVTATAALLLCFKECLVGTVDALSDILYGLGTYRTPVLAGCTLTHFREMHLEFICGKVLVVHPVIPAMESDAIVIDLAMVLDEMVKVT